MSRGVAAILAAAMLCAPASAHIGIVLPDSLAYKSCSGFGAITTFTDHFPAPEIVLSVPDFRLTGPSGKPIPLDSSSADHAMTRLEASLSEPGTHFLTTSERMGRMGKVAIMDGAYVRLGGDDTDETNLPAGTQVLTSQTATVSEAWFTCGGQETAPTAAPEGRLSLTPRKVQLRSGDVAAFDVRFDGALVPLQEAYLFPAYGFYAGNHDGIPIIVPESGEIRLAGLAPGLYALLVRHIAPAPQRRCYGRPLLFDHIGLFR